METTEKIVEAYVRYVRGWATIPNLRSEGQFEIDLLAIDPVSLNRYHIETSVSSSQGFSKLTSKEFDVTLLKERVQKPKQRRTIGFFINRKFGVPQVKDKLASYGFVPGEYRTAIVTWDWTPEAEKVASEAGVELWNFQNIISEIADAIRHERSYFTDDTLRTIHLFVRALADKNEKIAVKKSTPRPQPASSDPTSFWVYRNWIHNRARLHCADCGYCNNGRGTQNATDSVTGDWANFESLEDATKYLASLNYENANPCSVCM